MKRLFMALLLAVPLAAQETKPDDVMQMYIESAKPVAEHQRLAELQGAWKVTSRMWFEPGTPKTSAGSGKGEVILGGRFLSLTSSVKGDVPSDHLNILGFDRRTGEYTWVGFDTLGTYYVTAAGKWDDAMKGVVMNGSYAQPPTGALQKYRFVWRTPSKDAHSFTIEFLMNDKWMKVADMELSR